MKKITSLFLAILIVSLSVFSVNAFALPATETDAPPVTETDPVPETELLSPKWFEEHGNEFSADASFSFLGTSAIEGKFWFKNGKFAFRVTDSIVPTAVSQKLIYTGGETVTTFYTDLPFFYINKPINFSSFNIDDLSFIKAETTDEGYYVELFATPNESLYVGMAFKNGKLERFLLTETGLEEIEFIITSYEVDDKEFNIPFLAINATPIYRFLVLLGIVK